MATILGKTEGAVKSLQHRALVSLQKQIEQQASAWPSRSGSSACRTQARRRCFSALTHAEASASGKEHVGMAAIPDERLRQLAAVVGREEGDACCGARRRRAGNRRGAAREPAPGRRAARGARRLVGHARSRRRSRDAEARAARRGPRPRRAPARARGEAGEVGRRDAARPRSRSSSRSSRTSTPAGRSRSGTASCLPSSSR